MHTVCLYILLVTALVWMCPPQFMCWKLNPQCNSVRRWGLKGGVRSWGLCPYEGINAILKTACESGWVCLLLFYPWGHRIHLISSLSLSAMWHHSKKLLTFAGSLALPASRNVKINYYLYKLPSCGYSAIAAQNELRQLAFNNSLGIWQSNAN